MFDQDKQYAGLMRVVLTDGTAWWVPDPSTPVGRKLLAERAKKDEQAQMTPTDAISSSPPSF